MPLKPVLPLVSPPITADPLFYWVNQSENAAGWTTAVGRQFPAGTTYCGRCPRELCNIANGFCLVSVKEYVPDEGAEDLSLFGRPRDLPSLPHTAFRLSRGTGA